MLSMRQALVLGTALTTCCAVGLAALGIGWTDTYLTMQGVDHGMRADMRNMRWRALGSLMHKHMHELHKQHPERKSLHDRYRRKGRKPNRDHHDEDKKQIHDDDQPDTATAAAHPPIDGLSDAALTKDPQEAADKPRRHSTLYLTWAEEKPEQLVHSQDFTGIQAQQLQQSCQHLDFNDTDFHTIEIDEQSYRIHGRQITEFPRMPRRMRSSGMQMPTLPITVVIVENLQETLGGLHQRRLLLAATVLAATLLAAIGIWLVSKRVLRPLTQLSSDIANTTAGLNTELPARTTPQELNPVVTRLNELLHQVCDAISRERRVNADIAHELRTPLAGMRSQLEFALSGPSDVEELSDASKGALRIVIQMQELVENLLILVRLDGDQMQVNTSPVGLHELCNESILNLSQQAKQHRQDLNNNLSPELLISSDRVKLSMIISNLLSNAISHAPAGSTISITSAPAGTSAQTQDIHISNPVADANPDLAEHATEAFWRGDSARSDTGLHCGLGLSIASRLCVMLDTQLTIQVSDGRFTASICGLSAANEADHSAEAAG